MAATKIKYIYWIMRDCLIVSMCRDVVTSFEELLCAGVGCRPGYQGGAGQGRGHNQKTREQAASLHQPHRGTCTRHTCQLGVSTHSLYVPVYIAFVGELIFHVPLTVFHHQARFQQQNNCMKPGTSALLSSICRVHIFFKILISLSENEQNNKSCCIPLQST